jgi:type IV pilus assembly protein PilV
MSARRHRSGPARQGGMFLIEALIAILIFSLGILGMIAMGGAAVSATTDAQFRTEAANHADAIVGEIQVRANRTGTEADLATSLNTFQHNEVGTDCSFSGVTTGDARIAALLTRAAAEMPTPSAATTRQQILVENAAGQYNRVTVTICWQTAADARLRRHTMVTYVN